MGLSLFNKNDGTYHEGDRILTSYETFFFFFSKSAPFEAAVRISPTSMPLYRDHARARCD